YDIEPYDELVIMKGIGERTLLEALDYVVHRGDKLIIAGPNGTGKSTLLQVLDGKRRPSGGMVRLGTGAKPGIFVQQQTRRAGRVIDAIWNQYPRFTELEVRSHLARFGYRGEEVFKDCATLSGGEMARLRFAELALERPNLMFLDEPTNHLDIFMRETLTDALSAYTGTLLLVTHDRYLMQTLGCPILYLEDGKATFYQNFQKLHDRDTSKQPEPAKQEDKPQKAGYGKEQRRRRAEVRTRLKALETEIEELVDHIVELENEINDPEVLRDHLLLRDKCDELDDSRFHQQELYDEWEKLAEEQDRMDAESDS
ncbi:MAG: ATP-binding cassette domain-containing protein, partial [Subdoligranulum sp.]